MKKQEDSNQEVKKGEGTKEKEKQQEEKSLPERLMEIWKQAMVWAGIGAVTGVIYALIKKIPLINGLINGIYVFGLFLSIYAIFSAPAIFQRWGGRKEPVSTEVVQQAMLERKNRMNSQLMDYLRAVLVFLVGILIETIKFYLV